MFPSTRFAPAHPSGISLWEMLSAGLFWKGSTSCQAVRVRERSPRYPAPHPKHNEPQKKSMCLEILNTGPGCGSSAVAGSCLRARSFIGDRKRSGKVDGQTKRTKQAVPHVFASIPPIQIVAGKLELDYSALLSTIVSLCCFVPSSISSPSSSFPLLSLIVV